MSMIRLQGISLELPHKICFSDFSGSLEYGQRIAVVGENGAGKSTLLRMLNGSRLPDAGQIYAEPDLGIGYVEQIHAQDVTLSGGQRVNHAISRAMARATDLLLLDEPTNHLDADNRRSLARMLVNYIGSLVLVTHDVALMDQVCDTIWHIENGTITVFQGRYADFLAQQQQDRSAIEKQLLSLKRAQQDAHCALMKEQQRASHAKQHGAQSIQQRKWATIKSPTKLARGNTTAGKKQAELRQQRHDLIDQLEQLPRSETIVPCFHLSSAEKSRALTVQISDGAIGYDQILVNQIHLRLAPGERLALIGKNGSGKSTLAKAIMGETATRLSGDWFVPPPERIGYLDQHYADLNPEHSVLQSLSELAPDWTQSELRRHLSDFLFRENNAVNTLVSQLSGGEKARLTLACIAASTPELLVLDEVTNNLDMRTRDHMIAVLKAYPGTLLVISHDEGFLDQMGDIQRYHLKNCWHSTI